LHYHIVFGTKGRIPAIEPAWIAEFHRYIGGSVKRLGGIATCVGGVADHVHLLLSLGTNSPPSPLVRELKKASTSWARAHHSPSFAWQEGYGIFTVSPTHLDALKHYIARQEEHHRQVSFRDEFRRLLEVNGIEFKPEYLP